MDFLAALAIFVRAAETGSFFAVARERGVTQPAISRQIAALEEHPGARLVQRTTRRVGLTEDGRDFLGLAKSVLETVEQAESAVGIRQGGVSGLVRHGLRRGTLRAVLDFPIDEMGNIPDLSESAVAA